MRRLLQIATGQFLRKDLILQIPYKTTATSAVKIEEHESPANPVGLVF